MAGSLVGQRKKTTNYVMISNAIGGGNATAVEPSLVDAESYLEGIFEL
jgi:hypothetical protein